MNALMETLFEVDATDDVITHGLTHADMLVLQAAEGWLQLGNPKEALEELDALGPSARPHPVALITRAHVYSALGWGETALAIVRAVCELRPFCSAAWLCHANILQHVRGLKEAKALLLSIRDHFPAEALICYHLASFGAQLGEHGEAARWLLKTFEIDASVDLKLRAVQDPDFDGLWKRVLASVDTFESAALSKLAALSQYPV